MPPDQGGEKRSGGKGRQRNNNQGGGKRSSYPWINSQIISAAETGDLNHLLNTVAAHLQQMNLVNLSTALHRLAKLAATDSQMQVQLRHHQALEALLGTICSALAVMEPSEVQPQSVSNVIWSLATVRLIHKPLLQIICALSVANMGQFKPFELSTTLWALAKLGAVDAISQPLKSVFHAAAGHIIKNIAEFGFRCLATTAWAFATARQRHARLFRTIAAQMLPMTHSANCQEMANTAWAFGTADFHDDQLFNSLADKAIDRLVEFKPQELSNMLWGFATNGFFHEAFYATAADVAQRMDLQAQHLANILWAYARVRPRHALTQKVVLSLLPLCTVQLHTFKPQEVSSTALAVAKAMGLGEDVDQRTMNWQQGLMSIAKEVIQFFHSCGPWVISRLREFSAQSLANTVSAYVMVPVNGCNTLFDAIGDEVLRRFDILEPTALVHLLKGFASIPTGTGQKVLERLAAGVAQSINEMRPQELQALVRICSSISVLGGSEKKAALPSPNGVREMSVEEIRSQLLVLSAGVAGQDRQVQQRQRKAMEAEGLGDSYHNEARQMFSMLMQDNGCYGNDTYADDSPLYNVPQNIGNGPMHGFDENVGKASIPSSKHRASRGGRDRNRPHLLPQDFAQQPPLCTINESGMMMGQQATLQHVALDGLQVPGQNLHMGVTNQAPSQLNHMVSDTGGDDSNMGGSVSRGHGKLNGQGAMPMQQMAGPMRPQMHGLPGAFGAQPDQPMMFQQNGLMMGPTPGMGPGMMQSSQTAGLMHPVMNAPSPFLGGTGPGAFNILQGGCPGMDSTTPLPVEENPFLKHQMQRRNRDQDTRKWFIKNSFLHVENSDSDEDNVSDNATTSHRSSSVPTRMVRDDYMEERRRRQMPSTQVGRDQMAQGDHGAMPDLSGHFFPGSAGTGPYPGLHDTANDVLTAQWMGSGGGHNLDQRMNFGNTAANNIQRFQRQLPRMDL